MDKPSAEDSSPEPPEPPTTTTLRAVQVQVHAEGQRAHELGSYMIGREDRRSSNHVAVHWLLSGSSRRSKYLLIDLIGSGTFGEVFYGTRQEDEEEAEARGPDYGGLNVAVKCIPRPGVSSDASPSEIARARQTVAQFQFEINLLKMMDHPNILRYFDDAISHSHLFLVTEYARDGDLLSYLNSHPPVSETQALHVAKQLISGLEYAHLRGYFHRDIKCENIFLCHGLDLVKIGDWGFAGSWRPGALHTATLGSLQYAAPEICLGRPYFGPELDVWSLGVVIYAMLSGRLPFSGGVDNDDETRRRILTCDYAPLRRTSRHCQSFLSEMLCTDPKRRPSTTQLKSHPWMTVPLSSDSASGTTLIPRPLSMPCLYDYTTVVPALSISSETVSRTSPHGETDSWSAWSSSGSDGSGSSTSPKSSSSSSSSSPRGCAMQVSPRPMDALAASPAAVAVPQNGRIGKMIRGTGLARLFFPKETTPAMLPASRHSTGTAPRAVVTPPPLATTAAKPIHRTRAAASHSK